jgi:ubiquinone/menaquinone biosynthesis C-methylase UbiE
MFRSDKQDKFKNVDGIYSFINERELTGDNLKFNKLYNKIAWSYNLSQRIYFWLKFGGERKFREPFLCELSIKDSDKVLEISTGTGDNFRFLNKKAEYYGLDISMGMLRQAQKHLKKWKINSVLIHAEGEDLPFKDNYFDVVFHCGGINFFNDKQKAIKEMVRVAKPGTKILIVDETDKLVKQNYQRNPIIKNDYKDAEKANIPVEMVPSDVKDIQTEIICNGLMYKLIFTKP